MVKLLGQKRWKTRIFSHG